MEIEKKKKLNLSFSPDIIEYLQVQATDYGMSISAYLTMLVCNHRKENQALEGMQNIGGIMERLEELLNKQESNIVSQKTLVQGETINK